MVRSAAGTVLVCAVEATKLSSEEESFFRRVAPSGVTIFGRNCPPGSDLRELIRTLQSTRPSGAPPLVVAIDQEGGRVARLKAPFPNPGPAASLAGGGDSVSALAQIRGIAQDVGSELASLGINVNFAPVCDVLTEATNTSIGDRAFGVTPDSVTSRAGSFLEGLHEAGVLGCLKHFPGQGAATVDTHVGGATVALTRHELEQTHLPPFRSLLPFAPMVMISHCIYPALGPGEASSSKAIITGLLKDELGYNGVVVSDDMNMGAVPQAPA
ncbi:MAG: hypothetical protein RL011_878, partial [Pseudomonadota bacterium]